MARSRYEFIKIEMRLFNDPRFFMLKEFDRLVYITLIALAKQTHNRIRKDYPAIRAYLRTDYPLSRVRAVIKHLLSSFEDLSQNSYYIWFNKWDERYNYHGVEEEKEKEKEKEKDGKVSFKNNTRPELRPFNKPLKENEKK